MTLRLTSTPTRGGRRSTTSPPLPRPGPGREGQRLRVRAGRAGRRRRRLRRRDRGRHGARARRVPGRGDAGRADPGVAAARPAPAPLLTVGSADHVAALGAGAAGCWSSSRRRCAGSARRVDELGAVTAHRPRPPVSTSPASASTLRSPAPMTSTSTRSPRGSTCSIPTTRCGSATFARRVRRPRDAWPDRRFRSASAPPCGTATSRRSTSAPTCSMSDPVARR